jgi:hypothetical protein
MARGGGGERVCLPPWLSVGMCVQVWSPRAAVASHGRNSYVISSTELRDRHGTRRRFTVTRTPHLQGATGVYLDAVNGTQAVRDLRPYISYLDPV